MTNSRKLIVEVVGDSSRLERSFRQVETRSQKFSRRISRTTGIGGGFGGVNKAGVAGAAVAAGSALALKGLQKVVAAAKEAEIAQANLDQAFKASGVSSAKFGKQVDRAVQATSKLSAFDDEDVSASFASLLRTTGSLEKATRDSALAADIARARKISLAAATKVVEKAENGQLRGLKAIGVEIDKNTTATEALDRAQRKFAGSSEAYGKTAAGAQEKLGVAFENLEEKLGQKLLPTLTKVTLKLVNLIEWAEKNWPRFSKAVQEAYAKAKPAIDATVALIKGIANIVAGVVKIVHGLFTGDWAQAWKGFKQLAIDGIFGVSKAMLTLPAKIGAALTKKAFAGLSKFGTWIKDAIVSGLEGIGSAITKSITGQIDKALGILDKPGGLLNKLLPDKLEIPKLPKFGGATSAPPSAPPSRFRADTNKMGPFVVESRVYIDGRELHANQVPYRQRAANNNPAQRRGPNAGRVAG